MNARSRTFTPLEFPRQALDALGAGGGGPQAFALLRSARRSRNLLLLRALRERARAAEPDGGGGRVPAYLEDGLDLLRTVQAHAPAVFDAVMDDPMTGAWLGCWARGGPSAETAAEAASLAAAAAHRAGLRFRIEVPVRSGAVMLPGLGLALPPGAVDTAEVTGDGAHCRVDGPAGGVRVPEGDLATRDGDGWYGLRRVRCVAEGRTWTFRLDSLNPFRLGHDPVEPRPLDAEEAARWEAELGAAWRLLVSRHPARADEVREVVSSVVPLRGEGPAVDGRGGWLSATLGDAVGLVALAPHPGTRTLAAGLVHEVQHSKLCALLDLVDLLESPPGTRCYSPWREEPRPPSALLQGAYAFMAVAAFWRDETAAVRAGVAPVSGTAPGPLPAATQEKAPDDPASATSAPIGLPPQAGPGAPLVAAAEAPADASPETRFAHRYRQARAAVAELDASDWPTGDGRRFLTAMRRTLDSWKDTAPGPRHLNRAVVGAAEHRVRWRLRHLPQPRPAVELLVSARAAGRPAPVAAAALLRAPGTLPPDCWELPAAPPPPDTAGTAAELEALLSVPDAGGPEQWARLAAAALLLADDRAPALAAMPELVRAVHTALGPAAGQPAPGARGSGPVGAGTAWSPLDLAHWLLPVVAAYPSAPGA
ncbi:MULTISPECIES: aKG-HExxH-type peptide beta-hydroxylase [unclassified Streptomyces]|uniref:aKG-HExxH-type peptide beta-hydroxylase n=1 Tax=unclassified Streptomyces TaxID=2593676 RepID=UPI002E29BE8F|nr:HEXXH motif-containing putative peptide modification protein [Streptomyces sp. NBC_00223]